MAQFVSLAVVDLDRYPEADELHTEHPHCFAEVSDGDVSEYVLDLTEVYNAEQLIEWAASGVPVTAAVDKHDETLVARLRAAGFISRPGYYSGELILSSPF